MTSRLQNTFSFLRDNAGKIAVWLACIAVFSLSYTQEILYAVNQNTKFLHGLSQAGLGFLRDDWIAQTADPLPIFTWIVKYTFLVLGEFFYYIYFALLLGVYLFSIFGIVSHIYGLNDSRLKSMSFFTFFVILHSALAASVVKLLIGVDALSNLYKGLADQYILGHYLQNCVFGVFLLLAIYYMLKDRIYRSAICIGLSCLVHPAYLFSAGVLTVSFAVVLFANRRELMKPLIYCLICLVLVSPILVKSSFILSSDNAAIQSKAMDIIVNIRIPHHSLPLVWFDLTAVLKIVLVLFALLLVWRTRLFYIMLISLALATVATFAQIILKSNTLAMIAPWRLSAILVPLATALILGKAVSWIFLKFQSAIESHSRLISVVLGCLLGASVIFGIHFQIQKLREFEAGESMGVMNFVKENKRRGEVYLVPPLDHQLDRFRLYTGAPIFVNWKTHPYESLEVVEWYKKYLYAQQIYEKGMLCDGETLAELSGKYRITHIISEAEKIDQDCSGMLKQVYHDNHYALLEIR